jgi:hypothetical protein
LESFSDLPLIQAAMRIRLAKPKDAAALARVHHACSSELPQSFMDRLGPQFLRQYYRVLLQEKNSVVICAENSNQEVVGFISGSLDATEHMPELKRHRISLFLGALPALLRHPSLLLGMLDRQDSKSADVADDSFVVLKGARWEFWAYLPEARAGGKALDLFTSWLTMMRGFGTGIIHFEVDEDTPKIARLHRMLGARVLRKYITPEGKSRFLMAYPPPA